MATPAEIRRELNEEVDRYLRAMGGSEGARQSATRIVEAMADHPWLADQVPNDVWDMARRDAARLRKRREEAREDKPTRVMIREGKYRGRAGYLVIGSYERNFPTRVFVRRRESAEQIREILKSDWPLSAKATTVDRVIRSEGRVIR